MIDITALRIRELSVHWVGNLLRNEGVNFSSSVQETHAQDFLSLVQFLFGNLQRLNLYEFTHSVDKSLNTLFSLTTAISSSSRTVSQVSADIAKHLYSVSDHPRVKAGNLFVGIFDSIKIDGKSCPVLGIFKSEAVDNFIKVNIANGKSSITVDHGASLTSLDKLALIPLPPKGKPKHIYAGCVRGEEAVYWTERFLQLKPTHSAKADTMQYLEICRAFAKDGETDIHDSERLVFLNRSLQFFENSEQYDEVNFASVFTSKTQEQEFRRFKEERENTNQWAIPQQFQIEKGVVRKERTKFQKNIRLDSNIEIRLGFKDHEEMKKRVEHGFDPQRKMAFYKLYYSTED